MNDNFPDAFRIFKSFENDTRHFILECAVYMESKASDTLGRLLGIEWKESESLGYGSASIGFGKKISIIKDLKGVSSTNKKKFQCFMAIRNKFAHIAEVDSFSSFLLNVKSASERQKELKKWFPEIDWESSENEEIYKTAYLRLTIDLFHALFNIDLNWAVEKGSEFAKNDIHERFFNYISERLKETEFGNEILRDAKHRISGEIDY